MLSETSRHTLCVSSSCQFRGRFGVGVTGGGYHSSTLGFDGCVGSDIAGTHLEHVLEIEIGGAKYGSVHPSLSATFVVSTTVLHGQR